jgi:hypothetical protein
VNSDFDERHERMEIFLEIEQEHEFISDALLAVPFCYVSIMDGLNDYIKTLKNAQKRIKKIKGHRRAK